MPELIPSEDPPIVTNESIIYAVLVLILNKDKNLAVGIASRTDSNSFGLIGGKVEDGETAIQAAIRESKEESGLEISNLVELDRRFYDKGIIITYSADYKDMLTQQPEEPECKWCSFQELIDGRFGDYNKLLFEKVGII